MHEASLVQGLLELALKSRENYNASHPEKAAGEIKEICCTYGLLACFEPQTLLACFELFAEGTAAEKAKLILSLQPLPCKCETCGREFELLEKKFDCPYCGSGELTFSGGTGLVLHSINVDSGEKDNG